MKRLHRAALVIGSGAVASAAWRRFDASHARRTATLTRLSAKSGAQYATLQARSKFVSPERQEVLKQEFEIRTAQQVTEVLGNMKGAVMKLGQMASYIDQGLPEHVREMLAQLQTQAPPMAYELVEQVVSAELGGSPLEVFAQFDPTPIAAASIGQVHRAVTKDGREVAVKIQYPGVDAAIKADLQNSDLLFGALGTLLSGLDPKPIVEELRARLIEELDYVREAENQQFFADYYRGHPNISVPEVLPELCTSRVLVTEFVRGATWSEALHWPDEERNLLAETLYRYAFGGIYRLGAFNGDPHPGNYLCAPGGKITFLDYGLCKFFTEDEIQQFSDMIRAMVLDHDMAEVRKVWTRAGVIGNTDTFTDEELRDYFIHFFEQVMEPGRRLITSDYASKSLRKYFDLNGPHKEMIRSITLPASLVIIQRINLGLWALIGELNATADWRAMAEELWPSTNADPSTPMGQAIRTWEEITAKRTPDGHPVPIRRPGTAANGH